jgi:hypothetical protein
VAVFVPVGKGGISVVQRLLYCVYSYFSCIFTELIKLDLAI